MHIESAHSQSLVPRRAQHLVRGQIIQSVVQPATDQGTYYTADGTANRCRHGHRGTVLRRPVDVLRGNAATRSGASTCACACACTGAGACTRSCP
jgi:hypothetical protein